MADPNVSKRIVDVLTVLASVAGSLGIVWAFLVKIGKPFGEWQQRRRTEIVRTILREQLEALDRICAREEESVAAMREMFREFDKLLDIALDNRERHNETNELLDALGLASRDRRADRQEERERLEEMVEGLVERRKERRRHARPLKEAKNEPGQ